MNELKLFLLEDGEHHFIAAKTADEAILYHTDNVWGDEVDEDVDIEVVRQIPPDEEMTIFFPDGIGDDDDELPESFTRDGQQVTATVEAWLGKVTNPPEYVASSVY